MASAPHILISGEDVNVSVRPESSSGNTTIQGSYACVAGVNRSSVVADDDVIAVSDNSLPKATTKRLFSTSIFSTCM